MDLLAKIKDTREKGLEEAKFLTDEKDFESWRIKYLGRFGLLNQVAADIKNIKTEHKPAAGKAFNELKKEFEEIAKKLSSSERAIKEEYLDTSRPATRKTVKGSLHPLTLVLKDIKQIFLAMGFSVITGPEIETEFYNFDALNIPKNHPARDLWDTLWIKNQKGKNPGKEDNILLRTHTSPMQVRFMEKHQPPFKIIVPGTVYRHEAVDASHSFQFIQVEGLMVDKNISLANFKYIIETFFKKFFRKPVEFRFFPSYFPFVEPGVDIAIKWKGKWLEVAGAGMVHQKVFKSSGFIPGEWQGFAFGFGVNRLAMIKYNIPDIRLFYENDLRFLRQFE